MEQLNEEYCSKLTDIVVKELMSYENTVPNRKYCRSTYHPYDIEKHDTVVEFHVQECPGWLFSIWWGYSSDGAAYENHKKVYGEFFCKYESEIDKFKPQRAMFRSYVYIDHNDDLSWSEVYVGDLVDIMYYIQTEPDLAFCRDIYGYDYNVEYVSRRQAKKERNNLYTWRTRQRQEVYKYNKKIRKFIDWHLRYVRDLSILQLRNGENSWAFPHYMLIAPYEGNEELVEGPGRYLVSQFMDDKTWKNANKIVSKYRQLADRKGYTFSDNLPVVLWVKPKKDLAELLTEHYSYSDAEDVYILKQETGYINAIDDFEEEDSLAIDM